MCAPHGEKHGKGKKYPDWLIKAVRMEHFDFGAKVPDIARTLHIPESTVRHWCLMYWRRYS